jgi:hypothetical protein
LGADLDAVLGLGSDLDLGLDLDLVHPDQDGIFLSL